MTAIEVPARRLLGLSLRGGWTVVERAPVAIGATGGNFSEGYIVESDGERRRAFLKALDYSRALNSADPARALQALTEAFNYERDLLYQCRDRHLDRVVLPITDGAVNVSGTSQTEIVQYLIFELAQGDVRSQADVTLRFDLAWILRALHHVATGLWQLHGQRIAHQDLKPSNVLVFDTTLSKVADLGRATRQDVVPIHDYLEIAGDPTYAPPELLYGQVDPDWNCRRYGCDAYLLGSMVVFFFEGPGLTALIRAELRDALSWGTWSGTYTDVLPYVQEAFERVVDDFETTVDASVRDDITTIVKQLCEPDPSRRGHPLTKTRGGNQYSLERYVSWFNLLARRAELRVGNRNGLM